MTKSGAVNLPWCHASFFRFRALNFYNSPLPPPLFSLKDTSPFEPLPHPRAVMSVSLSSIPVVLKDRSYQGGMLKGSPARGFYPAPLPGPPHYMDFFPRTHNLLHPLKSLGRLVSDTQASLPLNLHAGGAPPFLGQGGHHSSVLHEHMLSAPGFPYLSQMLPGQPLYSKPEELAAVVTEHAAGPLSSDFSSPASERCPSASSSSSSSPPKESLFRLRSEELPQQKTRTSYNFSEDDLFMVLYGYSGSQERNVGHAISGLALPEKSGESCAWVSGCFVQKNNNNNNKKNSIDWCQLKKGQKQTEETNWYEHSFIRVHFFIYMWRTLPPF